MCVCFTPSLLPTSPVSRLYTTPRTCNSPVLRGSSFKRAWESGRERQNNKPIQLRQRKKKRVEGEREEKKVLEPLWSPLDLCWTLEWLAFQLCHWGLWSGTDSNAEKLIKLMKKTNLDALGMMNQEMTKSLTSFKDAASFSLVMVSPVVAPWEPEKSFRVNFHSRDRADRAKGTFNGLRKTTSTMMGSVGSQNDKRSQCFNCKRHDRKLWGRRTKHDSEVMDLRMYQVSWYSENAKGSIINKVSWSLIRHIKIYIHLHKNTGYLLQ